MKIEGVRSGWKVALSRALGLGITGQASEGIPGSSNSDRQINGARAVRAREEKRREVTTPDPTTSTVTATSSKMTDAAPAGGGRGRRKTRGIHGAASGGCGGVSEDTRHDGAVSRRPTQLARGARGRRKTPGAPRRRQERAGDEHDVWFVVAVAGARHPAGGGASSTDLVVRPLPPPRRSVATLPPPRLMPPADGAARPLVSFSLIVPPGTGPLALRARSAIVASVREDESLPPRRGVQGDARVDRPTRAGSAALGDDDRRDGKESPEGERRRPPEAG
ncbi:hypothetical protein THAOC_12474 [Thalassiosira oceanica]|uniref:Uncharacterized protein n=1 Tax=Thalassiosira oceanica TaxID=159749 RepID=K0T804_THAOC|nr:hypothetical protein THAOC_12474 [Thalassiosira oceanica]|eukprot:EJK66597.1 hypothetical protein THAOC_12474 [Thalassiosira oceanica]